MWKARFRIGTGSLCDAQGLISAIRIAFANCGSGFHWQMPQIPGPNNPPRIPRGHDTA